MKIARFKKDVAPFKFKFKKDVTYVITNALFDHVLPEYVEFSADLLETYPEKFYKGQPLDNKSLITIRNGGIGDLLFETPSLRKLKNLYPSSSLTLACNDKYSDIFYGVKEFTVEPLPLEISDIEMRDYFLIFEDLIESNPEAEFKNAYELHEKQFGFNKGDTSGMLPIIGIDPIVEQVVERYLKPFQQPILVMPYAASVAIRSIDPSFWYQLWGLLASYDLTVFMVGSPAQQPIINQLIKKFYSETHKKNINVWPNLISFKGLRGVVSLINQSKCVVGPDSGLLHIAGALEKPIVGLYGAFPSQLRISTYKNSIGLDPMTNCPFARGEYKSCFQHQGYVCEQAEKMVQTYSPCMNFIGLTDVIKSLIDLDII